VFGLGIFTVGPSARRKRALWICYLHRNKKLHLDGRASVAGFYERLLLIPFDGLSMLSAGFEDAFTHAQCQFSRQMAETKFPSPRYAQIKGRAR
jgi:hypothetical protein